MKKTNLIILSLALFASSILAAPSTNVTYVISGNTPGFIKQAIDNGSANATDQITVTVWLKLHNENQLSQLLAQQTTKGSGQFHKWLSQDQFNATYSPTAQEVNAVQNFLSAHNLTVLYVAENNFYIKVQGAIADIQKTFHVQIHNYSFNGSLHRSNNADPSVNDTSGGNIAAITGMDDYGFEPAIVFPSNPDGSAVSFTPLSRAKPGGVFFEGQAFRPVETDIFTGGGNTATYTGNRYGADITNTSLGHLPPQGYSPDEIQTAYNLKPLYRAGLDGTGETIVITDAFGSATIAQDAAAFSTIYGLPPINLQIVRAPGISNNPHGTSLGWDGETTLDVEWAHAIAPGAKIALVVATDRASLDEAINYAVVHHLGNTISNSWASREGFGNPAQFNRVNRILQMAAAQGIDVNFASGDDGDESQAVGFITVDFPASSPFATGIGGTSLALNPDNSIKFETGWGNNLTRIADRISLGSPPVVPPLHLGFQFGAGGGASLTFARPSFQSGLSVPGNTRLVPDISMFADPFTGAEIIQTINGQLSVGVIGGTSLSTPVFSGVMAIAAQKAGHGLGQAAPLVYNLPAGAVTDVVAVGSAGNVTGVINGSPISADALAAPLGNTTTYYSALYNSPFSTRWFVITFGTDTSLTTGPGWDNVTGVGTPNGANFINAIAP
ncbi:MAG TPA: S53 family peptidase [Chthoniobacterales bacterium]|nr:S53 family peptidase [Chthoniobacterales bacterium]